MKIIGVIPRLMTIINNIESNRYISLKELQNKVEDTLYEFDFKEIASSERTLRRDIKNIQTILNIPIKYSKIHKGYYIEEDQERSPDYPERLLEAFDILNALNADTGLNQVVYPERSRNRGTENLLPLVKAIKNENRIRFNYQKMDEDFPNPYEIDPYAVKESCHRWYVLGVDRKVNKFKAFGLDRLSSLEIIPKKYSRDPDIDIKEKYKDSFGIFDIPDTPVEDVILSYNTEDGEYIKSLPIHPSQEIIRDDPDENILVIKLHIKITDDLIMELITRSWSLKVLEPEHLVERICKIYQDALNRYSDSGKPKLL